MSKFHRSKICTIATLNSLAKRWPTYTTEMLSKPQNPHNKKITIIISQSVYKDLTFSH